jgi:dTDP-4-amino-4,6-dideoxygalactose transaminase
VNIGAEELKAVISLWPLSARQQAAIRALIDEEPLRGGAWLFRYHGTEDGRVGQLEQAFAAAAGAKHAVAVNSGTSALIAALVALGIGPGDDVLVPAYTFIATASSVLIAGAIPNLVEIDESLTIDIEDARRKITPRTRAILPVHMRGRPCQMDAIMGLAREYRLHVVEDVAQACGGHYGGRWLGTHGNAGCFSFDQYKILNAGEGGMVVTDDDLIATRVRSYHDTAACWRPQRYAVERIPGELFAGENYRMSELHGAVALEQLTKLTGYLSRNRAFLADLFRCLEPAAIAPLVLAPHYDRDGDAAEWVVLLAPDANTAAAVTQELLARQVCFSSHCASAKRDWHIYRYWQHILDRSTANRVGHPYASYPMESLNYSTDACPRTLEILERSVFLYVPSMVDRIAPATVWDAVGAAAMQTVRT